MKFKDYLQLWENVIIEGVDINHKTKTVSFNNNHENNVDTGLLINPTYSNVYGVDVISIFKRKKSSTIGDGNPLVHALKGNNGWSIDDDSIRKLYSQFLKIVKNINQKYDTIVKIQSSNVLNTMLLHRISKQIPHNYTIDDIFTKLSVEDVLNCLDTPNLTDTEYGSLMQSFERMALKGDTFSYKEIDPKYRHLIKTGCVLWSDKMSDYEHMINDKTILLLDDTIASGKTISDSVSAILETYQPKSVTVLTLFSKLE